MNMSDESMKKHKSPANLTDSLMKSLNDALSPRGQNIAYEITKKEKINDIAAKKVIVFLANLR